MKLRLLLTAGIVGIASAAFAQFSNGGSNSSSSDIESDYNRVYASFVTGGASCSGIGKTKDDYFATGVDKYGVNGFNVGFAHGFNLTGPLFLEGGLEFNYVAGTEAGKYGSYPVDYTTKMMSIAIPVNVTYQFAVTEDFTIAPLAGLNFKFNISGKEKGEGERITKEYSFFDSDDMEKATGFDQTANRFQIGMNLGVNVIYAKHYMFGYRFQHDFSHFYKYEEAGNGYQIDTNYHYLTLGYIF